MVSLSLSSLIHLPPSVPLIYNSHNSSHFQGLGENCCRSQSPLPLGHALLIHILISSTFSRLNPIIHVYTSLYDLGKAGSRYSNLSVELIHLPPSMVWIPSPHRPNHVHLTISIITVFYLQYFPLNCFLILCIQSQVSLSPSTKLLLQCWGPELRFSPSYYNLQLQEKSTHKVATPSSCTQSWI